MRTDGVDGRRYIAMGVGDKRPRSADRPDRTLTRFRLGAGHDPLQPLVVPNAQRRQPRPTRPAERPVYHAPGGPAVPPSVPSYLEQ